MELIKIHPSIHILYYLILICFSMIYNNIYYQITFICILLVLFYLEGIIFKFKEVLKLYIPFALLIIILNPLCNSSGLTKINIVGSFSITFEAFFYGILMALAFLILLMIFVSFNEEISYQEMLYIFSKKFPHISLIIIMALRYIPFLIGRIKEYMKINKLEVKNESFKDKINLTLKSFGTVISWSLEDAMLTAKSMKARGYGLASRTSYLYFKFNKFDYFLLISMIIIGIFCIFGLLLGFGRINVYPKLMFDFNNFPCDIFYLAFILFIIPKILMELRERLYWVKL